MRTMSCSSHEGPLLSPVSVRSKHFYHSVYRVQKLLYMIYMIIQRCALVDVRID